MFTEEQLSKWKVTALKDELRKRKLPMSGNKAELIKRVLEAAAHQGVANHAAAQPTLGSPPHSIGSPRPVADAGSPVSSPQTRAPVSAVSPSPLYSPVKVMVEASDKQPKAAEPVPTTVPADEPPVAADKPPAETPPPEKPPVPTVEAPEEPPAATEKLSSATEHRPSETVLSATVTVPELDSGSPQDPKSAEHAASEDAAPELPGTSVAVTSQQERASAEGEKLDVPASEPMDTEPAVEMVKEPAATVDTPNKDQLVTSNKSENEPVGKGQQLASAPQPMTIDAELDSEPEVDFDLEPEPVPATIEAKPENKPTASEDLTPSTRAMESTHASESHDAASAEGKRKRSPIPAFPLKPREKRPIEVPKESAPIVTANTVERPTKVAKHAVEPVKIPGDTELVSKALRVDNFIRPFTEKQVRELLAQFGTIVAMWMPVIKTHCYVIYEVEEHAKDARQKLDDLEWPKGGKHLKPRFVAVTEAEAAITGKEAVGPSPRQASGNIASPDIPKPAGRDRPKAPVEAAPAGEAAPVKPCEAQKPQRKQEAVKTLDDLFRKTNAKPRIYYLPLTDEQVAEKKRKLAEEQKAKVGQEGPASNGVADSRGVAEHTQKSPPHKQDQIRRRESPRRK